MIRAFLFASIIGGLASAVLFQQNRSLRAELKSTRADLAACIRLKDDINAVGDLDDDGLAGELLNGAR